MQSGVQEMEGVTMDPAGPSTLLALAEGAAGDDGNLRLLSPFALLAAEDAQPSGELPEATACRRCQSRCRPWLRWIGWGMAACVFLSMAIGAWVFQKRLVKAAFRYRSAIVHGGFMGMVVTEIVFFLWVSLLLPTTGFEVLVAFTYGFPVSFAMSMIGKTAGSIAVFSVARRFLRERALKAVNKNVVLSTLLYTAQEHPGSNRLMMSPRGHHPERPSTLPSLLLDGEHGAASLHPVTHQEHRPERLPRHSHHFFDMHFSLQHPVRYLLVLAGEHAARHR